MADKLAAIKEARKQKRDHEDASSAASASPSGDPERDELYQLLLKVRGQAVADKCDSVLKKARDGDKLDALLEGLREKAAKKDAGKAKSSASGDTPRDGASDHDATSGDPERDELYRLLVQVRGQAVADKCDSVLKKAREGGKLDALLEGLREKAAKKDAKKKQEATGSDAVSEQPAEEGGQRGAVGDADADADAKARKAEAEAEAEAERKRKEEEEAERLKQKREADEAAAEAERVRRKQEEEAAEARRQADAEAERAAAAAAAEREKEKEREREREKEKEKEKEREKEKEKARQEAEAERAKQEQRRKEEKEKEAAAARRAKAEADAAAAAAERAKAEAEAAERARREQEEKDRLEGERQRQEEERRQAEAEAAAAAAAAKAEAEEEAARQAAAHLEEERQREQLRQQQQEEAGGKQPAASEAQQRQPEAAAQPAPGTSPDAQQEETHDLHAGLQRKQSRTPQTPDNATASATPIDPDTLLQEALASGQWKQKSDPKSGRDYYWNTATKEPVWDLRKKLYKAAKKKAEEERGAGAATSAGDAAPPPTPQPTAGGTTPDATLPEDTAAPAAATGTPPLSAGERSPGAMPTSFLPVPEPLLRAETQPIDSQPGSGGGAWGLMAGASTATSGGVQRETPGTASASSPGSLEGVAQGHGEDFAEVENVTSQDGSSVAGEGGDTATATATIPDPPSKRQPSINDESVERSVSPQPPLGGGGVVGPISGAAPAMPAPDTPRGAPVRGTSIRLHISSPSDDGGATEHPAGPPHLAQGIGDVFSPVPALDDHAGFRGGEGVGGAAGGGEIGSGAFHHHHHPHHPHHNHPGGEPLVPLEAGGGEVRQELIGLLQKYRPDDVDSLDLILVRRCISEQDLLQEMRRRYGLLPSGHTPPAATHGGEDDAPAGALGWGGGTAAPSAGGSVLLPAVAQCITMDGRTLDEYEADALRKPPSSGPDRLPYLPDAPALEVIKQVEALYRRYEPTLLDYVPSMLMHFVAEEPLLLAMARQKYAPHTVEADKREVYALAEVCPIAEDVEGLLARWVGREDQLANELRKMTNRAPEGPQVPGFSEAVGAELYATICGVMRVASPTHLVRVYFRKLREFAVLQERATYNATLIMHSKTHHRIVDRFHAYSEVQKICAAASTGLLIRYYLQWYRQHARTTRKRSRISRQAEGATQGVLADFVRLAKRSSSPTLQVPLPHFARTDTPDKGSSSPATCESDAAMENQTLPPHSMDPYVRAVAARLQAPIHRTAYKALSPDTVLDAIRLFGGIAQGLDIADALTAVTATDRRTESTLSPSRKPKRSAGASAADGAAAGVRPRGSKPRWCDATKPRATTFDDIAEERKAQADRDMRRVRARHQQQQQQRQQQQQQQQQEPDPNTPQPPPDAAAPPQRTTPPHLRRRVDAADLAPPPEPPAPPPPPLTPQGTHHTPHPATRSPPASSRPTATTPGRRSPGGGGGRASPRPWAAPPSPGAGRRPRRNPDCVGDRCPHCGGKGMQTLGSRGFCGSCRRFFRAMHGEEEEERIAEMELQTNHAQRRAGVVREVFRPEDLPPPPQPQAVQEQLQQLQKQQRRRVRPASRSPAAPSRPTRGTQGGHRTPPPAERRRGVAGGTGGTGGRGGGYGVDALGGGRVSAADELRRRHALTRCANLTTPASPPAGMRGGGGGGGVVFQPGGGGGGGGGGGVLASPPPPPQQLPRPAVSSPPPPPRALSPVDADVYDSPVRGGGGGGGVGGVPAPQVYIRTPMPAVFESANAFTSPAVPADSVTLAPAPPVQAVQEVQAAPPSAVSPAPAASAGAAAPPAPATTPPTDDGRRTTRLGDLKVVKMSGEGVAKWLEMIGFGDYVRAFKHARVTGGRLLRLELGDLMSNFHMEYADAQYLLQERERLRSVAATVTPHGGKAGGV